MGDNINLHKIKLQETVKAAISQLRNEGDSDIRHGRA